MARFRIVIAPDNPKLQRSVRRAVNTACASRGKVTNTSRKRVELTSSVDKELSDQMVEAALQAASRPLRDRARIRGPR